MFHVSGRLDVIFYPNHLPCCSTLHRHYAERVAKHVCNLISRAHAGLVLNTATSSHGIIVSYSSCLTSSKKRVVNAIHLSAIFVFSLQMIINFNECPHVPKLAKSKPPKCPIGVYWNTLCLMRDVWTIKTYMI